MSSSQDDPGGELQALPPELIETINQVPRSVLKSCHVSKLKKLAKLASKIDIHVQVRDDNVDISYTLYTS